MRLSRFLAALVTVVGLFLGGSASAQQRERTQASWSDGHGDCGDPGSGAAANGTGFFEELELGAEVVSDGRQLTVTFIDSVSGRPVFNPVSGSVAADGSFVLQGRYDQNDEDYAFRGRIESTAMVGTYTRVAHYLGSGTSGPRCTAEWTVRVPITGIALPDRRTTVERTTTQAKDADSEGGGSSWVVIALIILGLTAVGGGFWWFRSRTQERSPNEELLPDDDDAGVGDDHIEEIGDTSVAPPPAKVDEKRSDEEAELVIEKTQAVAKDQVGGKTVELGSTQVRYTITITNKGPGAARRVSVGDYLLGRHDDDDYPQPWDPEAKVAGEATSDHPAAKCTINKNLSGHFESGEFGLWVLAKGATWTITYKVEPTKVGSLYNGAAVRCDNLKRAWYKTFSLWAHKEVGTRPGGEWNMFQGKGGFEWMTDSAITCMTLVEKKP